MLFLIFIQFSVKISELANRFYIRDDELFEMPNKVEHIWNASIYKINIRQSDHL